MGEEVETYVKCTFLANEENTEQKPPKLGARTYEQACHLHNRLFFCEGLAIVSPLDSSSCCILPPDNTCCFHL